MTPWKALLAFAFGLPSTVFLGEATSLNVDAGGHIAAHLVRRQKVGTTHLKTEDAKHPVHPVRHNRSVGTKDAHSAAHHSELPWLAGTFPHDKHRGSMLQTQTEVKWEPVMRGYGGGELHKDLGEMLETDDNYPESVLGVFREADPDDPQKCGCALDRWDQYSICYGAYVGASGAWSFGINGYDPWGAHVLYWARTVPKTYDCFLNDEPDFWNEFSPVCLGTRHETRNGRKYTNLQTLLANVPDESALIKMDVEMQEWSILHSLGAEDFKRIRSLNVEYHFNYHCPTPREVKMARRVLAHVKQHLVVVDSAAAYYGEDCLVDGVPFPKILAVSYTAPSACFIADGVPTFVALLLVGGLVLLLVVITLPRALELWRNPPQIKLELVCLDRPLDFGRGWLCWVFSMFGGVFTTSDKTAERQKADPWQRPQRSKGHAGGPFR